MRGTAILALALMSVTACKDSAGGGGHTLRVLLTDAPFPFDQVRSVDVYIVKVDAATTFDTTTAVDWTTLVAPERTFNLLDLQDGKTALLGETQVPAGPYAAVRMVIRSDLSGITMADGSPAAVEWLGPAIQTIHAGVELPLSITTDGNIGDLVLDFDVGRSFVAVPNGFQFLPWIRAVYATATGTIRGTVTGADGPGAVESVANASISVYRSGFNTLTLAATGHTDAQGRFAIHYVSGGGPYSVEAAPPSGFQAGFGYVHDVSVTPGQATAADVVLGEGTSGGSGRRLSISGPSQVTVGESITLSAFVFSENGDSVYGAPVTWTNDNPGVARLQGSGASVTLTGLAVGSIVVVATSNELADSMVVTVGDPGAPVATVRVVPDSLTLAVGDSTGLQAIVRDAVGNVLSDRLVTWSVDSSVVNVLGVFDQYLIIRATATGTTTVRAVAEGKEGSARVMVH